MRLFSAVLFLFLGYGQLFSQGSIKLDRGVFPDMDLYDIIYTGDLYVAVGQNGLILTSEDALEWTPFSGISLIDFVHDDFLSVAWSGNMFVASGDRGRVHFSEDGVNWARAFVTGNHTLQKIIWHETAFIALGTPDIWTSNTGTSWTAHHTPTPLSDIACRSGLCVGVGQDGAVVTSTDLQTWQSQTRITNDDLIGIALLGSRFIAISDANRVFTSENGSTWSLATTLSSKPEVINVAQNRAIILQEEGLLATSADGLNWESKSSGIPAGVRSLIWDGERYVGVGTQGRLILGKSVDEWSYSLRDEIIPNIFRPVHGPVILNTSLDGIYSSGCARSWRLQPSPVPGAVRSIDNYDDGFMAVGDNGAILTSPNGYDWNSIPFVNETDTLTSLNVGPSSIILKAGTQGYARPLLTNDWETIEVSSLGFFGLIKDGQRFFSLGGLASQRISYDGYNWQPLAAGGAIIDNFNFFVGGKDHVVYYSYSKSWYPVRFAIVKDGNGNGGDSLPAYTWSWRWMDDHFLALGFDAFKVDGQANVTEIDHPWSLQLKKPTVSEGRAYIPFGNSNFKYVFDAAACECPIFKEPEYTVACLGGEAQLSIYAENATSYQWRKEGVPIPGATQAIFSIPSFSNGDIGNYDCIVQTACLTVTSARVRLEPGPGVDIELVEPSQALFEGPTLTANFSCDPGNLSWYWRDVHQDLAFGFNQQTVRVPDANFDRAIEIVVSSPNFTGTARDSYRVTLIDPMWIDPNDDGCQDANDLVHLAPMWLMEFPLENDPNRDGIFDIRDYLFIPSNGDGCSP